MTSRPRSLLLLLLAGFIAARAQNPSAAGAIDGIVLDQDGAALGGAQVTLKGGEPSRSLATTTDASGVFRFEKLNAGLYELLITREGFTPTAARVTIGNRPPAQLRIILSVADLQQEVSISAADAIQAVKINNNPYSAEYSRPGRGRIEVVTKPGSAQFHGEFNFLFRDEHLNARNVFAEARQPEQRRIYEGTLTGPLLRSKAHPTTFLTSFDREEEDLQSIIFATGPNGTIRDTFPRAGRDLDFSVRLTRQMSENSTLSAAYSYEDENVNNQGVGGFNLPEVATNFKNREDRLRFNHDWIISPKLANQISLRLGRYDTKTVSVNQAQRIVVQGAFTSGGAQVDALRTEAHWTLNEALTWSQGNHVVKGGIQVPDFSRRGINDRSNSAGTFYFSSLQDYLGGRPFKFEQQLGMTKLVFWEIVLGAYAQDEIRLRPNLLTAARPTRSSPVAMTITTA